jgi:RHS repeat-associated protein
MGKLASVKKNGSNDCIFVYDDLGRLSNRKVYDGNTIYNHRYEYNDLGQLQYFTYPDSYCIENVYNSYGELKQIKNAADNSLIYAADTRNKFRQPLKCRYGNETGVQYTYNAYGMLTGIKNGDVVGSYDVNGVGIEIDVDVNYSINNQYRQLAYSYNDRGFIESRTDAKVNQSETYTYDNLDRLTSYTVNGTTAASFTYGNTGNILTNSKVGIYSYGNSKPHAVTDIAGNSSCPISASQCDVTYNLRNKPTAIAENGYRITLDYDAAGMRRHTRYYQGNTMQKATAKISDVYEFELGSGAQRKLDYIYAEGQLVAVHVKRGIVDSLYYVMTDHLGSWNKVMDEDKNIVQQTHFDPWGNRMSYTAWNTPQTQTTFPFSRGYTGHEHYDSFKIINANARLYDPMIGRFFSPDPFVQAPDFTQNYNRYSYCMNNPVMFNDENGEWVHIVVGAVIGGVSNLVGNWRNCDGFWQYAAAFGAGAASGAVSAALPGWGSLIGGAITGATNSAIAQTGNNFTNNGAFNWEQFGTSCVAGAAAGIAGYGGGMLGARAANVAIGSLNIVSPVTKGFIGGVLGGGIGGYTGGFVGGLVMSNGNLDAALSAGLSGAYQGAGLGGATGVAGGFYYAKKHNLNPWTGVKKGSVTIGENMVRVSMAQKQLKNETIKSVWPKGLEGYIREDARIINPEAMDFNAQWIEFLKEQNAYIYDIGTPNGSPVSSPFYNMEQARTMDYLNLIKVNGIDGKIIWYRNGN